MINFIAIDFETANSKRESACSIGAVVVEDSSITHKFYSLIKPHKTHNYFDLMNVSIHGIREDDVESSPEFDEVWSQIIPLIEKGNHTIVAHYASFDCSVIRHTASLYDFNIPSSLILCSYAVSKTAWPDLMSYSLPVVAEHQGFTFDHHHAQADAEASARIILDACKEYDCESLESLQEKLNFKFGHLSKGSYTPSGILRKNLSSSKVLLNYDEKSGEDLPVYDKDIAITGTLKSMTRDVAFELIRRAGGRPRTSVSTKTEYLVMGTQDYDRFRDGHKSSKTKKAEEIKAKGYPIEIISEEDFLGLFSYDLDSMVALRD